MKQLIKCLLLLSLFFFSCEEAQQNDMAEKQLVVEAFLFANEAIDDIRIKTTFPLSAEEDLSVPINDAMVTLIKDGQEYELTSLNEEGNYHYPGTDLLVETGDVFQLEVIHDGISALAETTVPTPTTGLHLSQDTLHVPTVQLFWGADSIRTVIQEFLGQSFIQANWDNSNEDLYYLVVESVSDTLYPIFPSQLAEVLAQFRYVSEPTDASSLTFLAGTLESLGTYSVKAYHINKEYADLYENREQDSRDLNEPPSNITNALGVFSAFNGDEVFFEVVRE